MSLTCVEAAPPAPRSITVAAGELVLSNLNSITQGHP